MYGYGEITASLRFDMRVMHMHALRYCREAGVRHLEKEIEKICRKGDYTNFDNPAKYWTCPILLFYTSVARKVVHTLDEKEESVPTEFIVDEDQVAKKIN